jgi:hypothetical protein
MALSSVFVVSNSLRLRRFRGTPEVTDAPAPRRSSDQVAFAAR